MRRWRSRARSDPALRGVLAVLGRNIRVRREALGITQADAAERADLDAKHLQAVERGRSNVTAATLLAIARALETTPARLLRVPL